MDGVRAVVELWFWLCVHIDATHLLVSLVHLGVGKLSSMWHSENLLSQYSNPERDCIVKWDLNARTTVLNSTWYSAVVCELVLSRCTLQHQERCNRMAIQPAGICQLCRKHFIKLLWGIDYVNVVGMWVFISVEQSPFFNDFVCPIASLKFCVVAILIGCLWKVNRTLHGCEGLPYLVLANWFVIDILGWL